MSSPIKFLVRALAALSFLAAFARADVKVGSPFPDLSTFGLEGTLPAKAGQVVLVDFWATWCGPCKASFPAYSALQKELGEKGFTIIAVSVDKTKAPYDAFLKQFAPSFVTVRDGAQKLAAEVKPPGMPTSYLIDRKGILRSIHTGYHGEATARALREEVLKLLEEKS